MGRGVGKVVLRIYGTTNVESCLPERWAEEFKRLSLEYMCRGVGIGIFRRYGQIIWKGCMGRGVLNVAFRRDGQRSWKGCLDNRLEEEC